MGNQKAKLERYEYLRNELGSISKELGSLKNKKSVLLSKRNDIFIQFGNYCLHNLTERTFYDKFCLSLMESIEKLDFKIREYDKLIYFNELKRETIKHEYARLGSELCLL